jgi:hypothetical protein
MERMITSSITRIRNDSPTGLQELADVVNEWGGSFGNKQVSAAIVKAAKLQRSRQAAGTPLLDRLAGMWYTQLQVAEPRQLGNVLWACGKLCYVNKQLWSSTLAVYSEMLQHRSQNIPCQELSMVLWGMAPVASANRGVVPGLTRTEVEAVVCQVVERVRICVSYPLLEGVTPQNISNTQWAIAKLRISPGDAALNSLLQAMARPAMLEATVPQDLSNTLWAVSELRQHCSWQPQVDQRVWQRLLDEQQLITIADGGTPQNVANTIVALARLSLPAGAACASIAVSPESARRCALQLLQGKLVQQLDVWGAQPISNIL